MNSFKRAFNPLFSQIFTYEQSEDSSVKYTGNWGPAIQPGTIDNSAWTVQSGDAELSSENYTTSETSVIISGTPGESIIVNKIAVSDGQTEERIIRLRIFSNDIHIVNNDCGYYE